MQINHSGLVTYTFAEAAIQLKVNNRNTRARYEICSELTVKIPE